MRVQRKSDEAQRSSWTDRTPCQNRCPGLRCVPPLLIVGSWLNDRLCHLSLPVVTPVNECGPYGEGQDAARILRCPGRGRSGLGSPVQREAGPCGPCKGAPRPEDEDDTERREIDAATLRAARETVTFVAPDAVLADAMGHASQEGQAVRAEDLRQLRGAEDAIDDLEIWSFGNT